MKELKLNSIELKGKFMFEPLNLTTLTGLICGSKVSNKEKLLQALWWPKSDWFPSEKSEHKHSEITQMRMIGLHLHEAMDSEFQGGAQKLQYHVFSHGKEFFATHGYEEAMKAVESRRLICTKLMWFISLVLQMSDDLRKFAFAAPIHPTHGDKSLYPYHRSGQLWFEEISGDSWADYQLTEMNYGLLFGVETLYY